MCGFLSVFGNGGGDPEPFLRQGCDLLAHRGPDDAGEYIDPHGRSGLGFRRLSILDLTAAGHQPMSNPAGTVWVAFNGEIYNHRALRERLIARGHTFRSTSDTEVLVYLWEERGPDMVLDLNGMFAFAIWDERTGTGFLARDHVGIKPLYIVEGGNTVWAASEAKALVGLDRVSTTVDAAALEQYLGFLWVPGRRTLWSDISKLEPGHRLIWQAGRSRIDQWWDWDQRPEPGANGTEWAGRVRSVLSESVERQLQSDVPVGAFLSGGLDSSAVVAAARRHRDPSDLSCYVATSGGDSAEGFAGDLPYARAVARHLGLDLRELHASPDIVDLWPWIVWHADEPLADPALASTYLISRAAREDGTIVLLTGQGGDELFHGYRSHLVMQRGASIPSPGRAASRVAAALASGLSSATGVSSAAGPRRVVKALRALGQRGPERALSLAAWTSQAERLALLRPALRDQVRTADAYRWYVEQFERSTGPEDVDRWSYVLLKTFMPALNLTYGDKAGMAASVELRVPLLDRELVELAGRIPARHKIRSREQKWVLGEAADPWLPEGIRRRPKTGFGVSLRQWLRGDLVSRIESVVRSDRSLDRGWFEANALEAIFTDLRTQRRDVSYLAWALFTLETWARIFLDGERPSR